MPKKQKLSRSNQFLITLTETDEGLTINGYHVGKVEGLAFVVGRDIMLQLAEDLSADNVVIRPIFRAATTH